tara:strand:+ start:391 stop:582 length:192 start_codon:yes stop_codon:yes gene_type:complete
MSKDFRLFIPDQPTGYINTRKSQQDDLGYTKSLQHLWNEHRSKITISFIASILGILNFFGFGF